MFSKRAMIFLLIFSIYNFSNQLLLFSEESILYYNQPKTYELNLKDILKKAGDNIQGSPIIISVYNKNETHTKLKVVSKLNSMPTLDSFNHSDFVGVNGIYSISYSPCEFNYQKDNHQYLLSNGLLFLARNLQNYFHFLLFLIHDEYLPVIFFPIYVCTIPQLLSQNNHTLMGNCPAAADSDECFLHMVWGKRKIVDICLSVSI